MTKIKGVKIEESDKVNKKYKATIKKEFWNKEHPKDIVNNDKIIYFGAKGYQQYHDQFGIFSEYDHFDEKRRQNYKKRHGAVKRGDGTLAVDYKYSPAWFSYYYLW